MNIGESKPTSKLIMTLDGEIVGEFALEQESISIGRKHENDIQLNDLTVSGRHALINNTGNEVQVEDLGSTNGTLINGAHINRQSLKHGNVIQIGHHQFTYLNDVNDKYEPTMFIQAEHDETEIVLPEWDMNDDAVALRGQPLGGLRKHNDPMGNMAIEMRKTYSTIGFQGKKLALINRGASGYSIVGIKGVRNRRASDIPLLNGKEVGPVSCKLKEGDIISIANIEMEFYFVN